MLLLIYINEYLKHIFHDLSHIVTISTVFYGVLLGEGKFQRFFGDKNPRRGSHGLRAVGHPPWQTARPAARENHGRLPLNFGYFGTVRLVSSYFKWLFFGPLQSCS